MVWSMTKASAIYELYLTVKWIIHVYISWVQQHIPSWIKRPRSTARLNIERLAQVIGDRPAGSEIKILRNERSSPSNSIRRPWHSLIGEDTRTKRKLVHFVNLGTADKILDIDPVLKSVKCEPGVTMEQLVDELLPYNLLPAVVPELKSLTVGGVLAGGGLESSSFRYGQFGDLLIEATYLLSNGQMITCHPTKDSDLFYGALGSCGTFGFLVSATLRVVDVKPDCLVRCHYSRTQRPIECFSSLHHQDYVDAIVFSDYTVLVTGDRIDPHSLPKSAKIQTFSKAWDPWYYQHVKTIHDHNHLTVITEYVPLKDYLFRYDRGAFWMGRYMLEPFADHFQHFPSCLRHFFTFLPFGGSNLVSRTFLSLFCTTSSLYKRLHASSISVIEDTLLIQDIYIPKAKARKFLSLIQSKEFSMQNNLRIEPIWLCPVRATHTPQKFSPHFVDKRNNGDEDDLSFFNFGLWSHQPSWQPGSSDATNLTKLLERKAKYVQGRKMLYALSYYSRMDWSNIYDLQWYEQMKRKWDPDYAWGDLYQRVVRTVTQ